MIPETELEREIRKKFAHLSNAQLIKRANSLPDFGWDDEEFELNRRRRLSNGKFVYQMQGNTLVILKDEPL